MGRTCVPPLEEQFFEAACVKKPTQSHESIMSRYFSMKMTDSF
jgi:hypothetical protein